MMVAEENEPAVMLAAALVSRDAGEGHVCLPLSRLVPDDSLNGLAKEAEPQLFAGAGDASGRLAQLMASTAGRDGDGPARGGRSDGQAHHRGRGRPARSRGAVGGGRRRRRGAPGRRRSARPAGSTRRDRACRRRSGDDRPRRVARRRRSRACGGWWSCEGSSHFVVRTDHGWVVAHGGAARRGVRGVVTP